MSVKEQFIQKIAVRKIANCLTGNPEDLKKLLDLRKVPVQNPGLRAFLKGLAKDMETNTGMAGLFLHLGKNTNVIHRRKLIENLIFNWALKGARIRTAIATEEFWVPHLIVVSPTMRCNLKCLGCYSGLYSKEGDLSEEDIDNVLTQAKGFGAYFVVISGGEPYLLKDSLLRLFKKHNDMFFLTYTNGTFLDERMVKTLAKLGNVAPAISVEGYKEHTDKRRSKGVYEKVMNAMDMLKKYGIIFGISVTYTKENIDLITKDEFIKFYLDRGAVFAWYFMFMPVGKDPILDLVPTPEQRVYCGQRVAEMRKKYPIFMADFWNDGPAIGGCIAGARSYLHILNTGKIEPCVFAHFGVDNIREKTILEAANSPFFRAIRREFPYNENANLKRPCMIIDNPTVLRKVVDEYLVPQGHQHSEDIIHDPKVVSWIDDYSERYKKLTDPVWEEMIKNPEYRWYKDGEEYNSLFRFKKIPKPAVPKRKDQEGKKKPEKAEQPPVQEETVLR